MSWHDRQEPAGPLFDRPWNKPVSKPTRCSLERAFREFHAANPHVLERFTAVALASMRRGHKMGAKAIVESLRWGGGLSTTAPAGHEAFRVPNAHVAFYARLATYRTPELAGFFDLARQSQETPFDPSTVVDGASVSA